MRKSRALRQLQAANRTATLGSIMVSEPARGPQRSIRLGNTIAAGGLGRNPGEMLAWRIRSALSPRQTRQPDITVYDAAGKPIAVIDGETREQRPLP